MLRFRYHVLRNLLASGRIGQTTLDILDRFHHPGFSAYQGQGVAACDSPARERLASYIVHPAFSLARLHYDRDAGVVTYDPRPSSRSIPSAASTERFSPLDALAALTAFIPEKGQQVVRYCGYYSSPGEVSEQDQAARRKVCPAEDSRRLRRGVPRARGTVPGDLRADWLLAARCVTCPAGKFRVISSPSAAAMLLPGKANYYLSLVLLRTPARKAGRLSEPIIANLPAISWRLSPSAPWRPFP